MQTHGIWLCLFDNEKIPRIEGRSETAKADLQWMLCHTYSARQMACLGKFVGEVPKISAKAFEMFKTEMDAYEPDKKLSDTFVWVVEPTHVHRDYNEALLNDLVANQVFDAGVLEEKKLKENGLLIPYSLKSLKILVDHPLAKKGKGAVFYCFNLVALEQCSTIARVVKVSLMRKEVPEQSRNLYVLAQKECLKQKEHEMVSLGTRGYFDCIEILNHDTCPDKDETYSRTSDVFKVGEERYPLAIGDFKSGVGLGVPYQICAPAHDTIGAAPVFRQDSIQQTQN